MLINDQGEIAGIFFISKIGMRRSLSISQAMVMKKSPSLEYPELGEPMRSERAQRRTAWKIRIITR